MTTRVIVVQAGASDLLRALQRQFAHDPSTVVITDRRRGRPSAPAGRERRFPQDADTLQRRGFYAVRLRLARRQPDPRV
ncbi:MAG TPA: hypothetical protein VMQ51_12395 [Candidatus Binatia bacterium]|nr:hypothetical protein [Candidatus Binatia bacterium]